MNAGLARPSGQSSAPDQPLQVQVPAVKLEEPAATAVVGQRELDGLVNTARSSG
jgi:hypothetical protein